MRHFSTLWCCLHLHLATATALAVGALGLLGASSLLRGLALDGASDLLGGTLDLVLDRGLALVVGGGSLSDASGCGLLGGGLLDCGSLLASSGLTDRVRGHGSEDAWLGIASGGAGGGHCDIKRLKWFWG
jgi:hypothetical protein